MKTKLLCAVFAALALLTLLCSCAQKTDGNEHITVSGVLLKGRSESFIIDGNNPIAVRPVTENAEKVLDELESGDKIKITCAPIRETYPASTDIYEVELLEKGDKGQIDKDVINMLSSLGWL